jgi:hypothetical protein
MSPEVKLRTLAAANATMQSRFGTAPFRWFDQQLDPRRVSSGTCLRARKVSTVFRHVQAGLNPLQEPLFQFDVMDLNPETARAAATDLIEFLGAVDLSTDAQFGCPTTTPKHYPSFVVNQRSGLEPIPDPPVYVESVDVRFMNLGE